MSRQVLLNCFPELYPLPLPHLSLHRKAAVFAAWLNICLSKQASKCPRISYTSIHTYTHTHPDAHQHQACCCLPPTETYPVFIMACLFLKACSGTWEANQIEQKGNLWIKLLRDRCSLTVGRGVGSFGEAMQPGAAKCARRHSWHAPGPLILGEGKGDFLSLPQLVPHSRPGDPFCLPSFCHLALD